MLSLFMITKIMRLLQMKVRAEAHHRHCVLGVGLVGFYQLFLALDVLGVDWGKSRELICLQILLFHFILLECR